MLKIDITDQQSAVQIDGRRIRAVISAILRDHGPPACRISVAIVDDPTIHDLNRQFLQHDYPTDVLSFVLESTPELLEGEIVVSGDTAVAQAGEYSSTPEEELMLYVIHGTLHLVGFDDHEEVDQAKMRRAEQDYLRASGSPSQTE
jgi:probable rRNA maturation factor